MLLIRRRQVLQLNSVNMTEGFLERSDLPGVYYSTLHTALNAVKADYPNKLTKDVTIHCIGTATEVRDPQDPNKLTNLRIWTAVLEDWNKDSVYSLTINGHNRYTLSAYSLGGVHIERCDNIIFRGIRFTEYSNYVKGSSPEELSAIYSTGSTESKNKNILVIDCIFEGRYLHTNNIVYFANFALDTKLTSNLFIYNCQFSYAGAVPIKSTDTDVFEIKKSYISGNIKRSDIAHECLFNVTGAYFMKVSDCMLNGETLREYGLTLIDIKQLIFERCTFYNFGGTILDVSGIEELTFNMEACLFFNCLIEYILNYLRFFMRFEQDLKELNLFNNTFMMNGMGAYYQETVSVNGNVGTLNNYNNIFIESNLRTNAFISILGEIGNYYSSNNVYKATLYSIGTRFNATQILVCPSFNTAHSITEVRNLVQLQTNGFEDDSTILGSGINLLKTEIDNSLDFNIAPDYQNVYFSNNIVKAMFDRDYKQNVSNTSIGALNINGVLWNEISDTDETYRGKNLEDDETFSNLALYTCPSEDPLLIKANTLDRTKLVKFIITSDTKAYLFIGNTIFVSVSCEVDENGLYIGNTLYDVELIKQSI